MDDLWKFSGPGISDHLFLRGSVPMTREEVRVITLSKARIGPGMVIWDVGSGTGSIAVEAARIAAGGSIWAVERSPEGCRLIRENCSRFGVRDVSVVEGEAPEALYRLPSPHRVIIGGSGGRLAEILKTARDRLLPGGRIVINAVTLETLQASLEFLGDRRETEIVQVSVNKSVKMGQNRIMKSNNPVYIISAWGWGDGDGR